MPRSPLLTPNDSVLNKSHPLARGLVAAWVPGMGGFTGRTLRDLSGRHHHGTLNGPVWSGDSKYDGNWGTVNFDGTDDYIEADSLINIYSNQYTFISLFTIDSQDSASAVWSYNDLSSNFYYSKIDLPGFSNRYNIGFEVRGTGGLQSFQNTNTYNYGFPVFSASISESTSSRILRTKGISPAAYFSGSGWDEATGTTDIDPNGATSLDAFSLGRDRRFNATIDGNIHCVLYYQRALTDSETKAIYYEAVNGFPTLFNRSRKRSVAVTAGGGGGTTRRYTLTTMGVG